MGSQELFDYVRAMAIAVFDIVVGFAAGQIIDAPFGGSNSASPDWLPINDMGGFWKVLGLVVAECAVTATVLIGLRRLMYPPDTDDLTGGMFFMQGIMHQSGLWENLIALWSYGYGKIRRAPVEGGSAIESGGSSENRLNH